jgi:hypothetical protein
MDERADARDNEHHRHRERIHAQGPRHIERAHAQPGRERHHRAFWMPGQGPGQRNGHAEGQAGRQAGHPGGEALAQAAPEEQVERQAGQRHKDHQRHDAEETHPRTFRHARLRGLAMQRVK